jgi:membrane-associated protease RseP (regulator of RpoE activity)
MSFHFEERGVAGWEMRDRTKGRRPSGAAARRSVLGLLLLAAAATGLAAAEPEPAKLASRPVVTGPVVEAAAVAVTEKPLRAWLGVNFSPLESRENGWKVTGVLDDAPASRAGIREGDVITAIDGTSVVGVGTHGFVDLMRGKVGQTKRLTLAKAATGKSVTVDVQPKYMDAAELAAWRAQRIALLPVKILKLPFALFGTKPSPPAENPAAGVIETEIPLP